MQLYDESMHAGKSLPRVLFHNPYANAQTIDFNKGTRGVKKIEWLKYGYYSFIAYNRALVAQPVERESHNLKVEGSIPS